MQSKSDYSLFTLTSGNSFLALLVYIDDIIVAGTHLAALDSLQTFLSSEFMIKSLGDLKYFLGLEVARSHRGLHICQRKYTLDILADSGSLGAHAVKLPMEQNLSLRKDSGQPVPDGASYRRLIGRLLYLTITKPDICFVIQRLSQFMHRPTDAHLHAAHQILRYLKKAPRQEIFFSSSSSLLLHAYCHSNCAGCPNSHCSVTRYCIFLGSSLISWRSKKQSVVSRSSAKAEYHDMASTSSELLWIRSLLTDLHISDPQPTTLHCDNQVALHIVTNPIFQLTDLFTKALPSSLLFSHLSKLGIENFYSPACRGISPHEDDADVLQHNQ